MAQAASREELEAQIAELRHKLVSAQMAAEGWEGMYEEAIRADEGVRAHDTTALRRWTMRDLLAGAVMFAIFGVLWVLTSLRIIRDPGME